MTQPENPREWNFTVHDGESLMDTSIKRAVSMAIGGGSMCWIQPDGKPGTGNLEFDSGAAADVAQKLNDFIQAKHRINLVTLLSWAIHNGMVGYTGMPTSVIVDTFIERHGL